MMLLHVIANVDTFLILTSFVILLFQVGITFTSPVKPSPDVSTVVLLQLIRQSFTKMFMLVVDIPLLMPAS